MAFSKIAVGLICALSLLIGVLRFSILSTSYYLVNTEFKMSPSSAVVVAHSSLACFYLFEVVCTSMSAFHLTVSKTSIALSGILIILATFYSLGNGLFYQYAPLGISTLLVVCSIIGGLHRCTKRLFDSQFDLPEDQESYCRLKFWMIEATYVGKTIGGILCMWTKTTETHFSAVVWVFISILMLSINLVGLKLFKHKPANRNIVGEFVKHTMYVMKEQLAKKRTAPDKFPADDMERIKILHSVLPLYLPVIILIGMKDLKYSRYVWQSMELALRWPDGSHHDGRALIILYPVIVTIALPIYFWLTEWTVIKRSEEKKNRRTTTRAIVAFYFLAASLACAVVLQCQIEYDRQPELNRQKVEAIMVFNLLPYTVFLSTHCSTSNFSVPSLSMITIPCVIAKEFTYIQVTGNYITQSNERHYLSAAVLNMQQPATIVAGYDRRDFGRYWPGLTHLKNYKLEKHNHEKPEDNSTTSRLMVIHNLKYNQTLNVVPIGPSVYWTTVRRAVSVTLEPTSYPVLKWVAGLAHGRYSVQIEGILNETINFDSLDTFGLLLSMGLENQTTRGEVILIETARVRNAYLQLPQIVLSCLAEVLIEAPGFVYARQKELLSCLDIFMATQYNMLGRVLFSTMVAPVPLVWQDFTLTVWTFTCFLGNIIVVIGTSVLNHDHNLFGLISGSASSTLAISLVTVFLLDYYKEDYVGEHASE